MTDKGTAKSRFISEFLGAVKDWDMHLFEALDEGGNSYFKLILEEQEVFGDITNDGLGRELWFSNDFFINHLIQYFMEHAQDEPDL